MMEKKTVKDLMAEWLDTKRRVAEMDHHMRYLMEKAYLANRPLSAMPSACGRATGRFEDSLLEMTDFQAKMRSWIELEYRLAMRVEKLIGRLVDPQERMLMERRYLLGQKWEEIRAGMYLSETQVYRLHRNALKKLEAHLAEEKPQAAEERDGA